MFSLLEAQNFRCLRRLTLPLGPLTVLTGPCGGGKSTILAAVRFLSRLVADGLEAAVDDIAEEFSELFWQGRDDSFELALEAPIPARARADLARADADVVRYEIAAGWGAGPRRPVLLKEKVLLKAPVPPEENDQPSLFPSTEPPPPTIITPGGRKGCRMVVNRGQGGQVHYYSETNKKWNPTFTLGQRKSALGHLPEDLARFPVATWFKEALAFGIFPCSPGGPRLGRPCPPGPNGDFGPGLTLDGANLPWLASRLAADYPKEFEAWRDLTRMICPEIEDLLVSSAKDGHQFHLEICYKNGVRRPAWTESAGILRFLALTLPTFRPGLCGLHLIEEPENGLAPENLTALMRAWTAPGAPPALIATHSALVRDMARPEDIRLARKNDDGATEPRPMGVSPFDGPQE